MFVFAFFFPDECQALGGIKFYEFHCSFVAHFINLAVDPIGTAFICQTN
jgi:hypothetical protein